MLRKCSQEKMAGEKRKESREKEELSQSVMSVRGTSCNLLYAGKGAPAAKGSFPSKESQKHD